MGDEQIATQLGPCLAAPSFISHRWGAVVGALQLALVEAREPLLREPPTGTGWWLETGLQV